MIFLHKSHRFKNDKKFGILLRRFCYGRATKQDIQLLNTRWIGNENVQLPDKSDLRYCCATNKDRNALSSSIFLEHLKRTHKKAGTQEPNGNMHTNGTMHTAIIKADITLTRGKHRVARRIRNAIYDNCGDDHVRNNGSRKVQTIVTDSYEHHTRMFGFLMF